MQKYPTNFLMMFSLTSKREVDRAGKNYDRDAIFMLYNREKARNQVKSYGQNKSSRISKRT